MSSIGLATNISALLAQQRLRRSTQDLNKSYERLSSGLRINKASDDAAGLSIASGLRVDSRVYAQGIRNLNDGVSLLNIADGALGDLSNVTLRLRELATQAANGVYSLTQRQKLNAEANALVNEFNRLAGSTRFNGLHLLDRSVTDVNIQSGYGSNGTLSINLGDELKQNVGTGIYGPNPLAESTIVGSLAGDVQTGDFNNDGKLDIIRTDATAGGVVGVALGNGQGSFNLSYSVAASGAVAKVAVGDFNADGNLDFAVSPQAAGQPVTVRFGNGQGNFTSSTTITLGGTSGAIGAADFNGDGTPDLVVSDSADTRVYLSNKNGTFATALALGTGNTSGLVIGDFNGDDKVDIATNKGVNVAVVLGLGQGTFGGPVYTDLGVTTSGLAAGDFDGDGRDDLVVSVTGSTRILKSVGNGTLTQVSSFGSTYSNIKVADLNGDGIPDIAGSTGSTVNMWRIDANQGATSTGSLFPIMVSGQFAIGDFTGDGVPDIATDDDDVGGVAVYTSSTEETTEIARLNINTRAGALAAINTLSQIMSRVTKEIANLGAGQSRIGAALSNLSSVRENLISAESRITDVDVGEEAGNLARTQIIQSAGAAVLAQANLQPGIVLQLLRDAA